MDTFICSVVTHITNMAPICTIMIRTSTTIYSIMIDTKSDWKSKRSNGSGHGARSDWAVIVGLFALLTFSPCEAFLPVFLIGSKYGWFGFAFLSAVLATATVAGMVTFTWLTLLGSQRLHFQALDKYEAMIVGGIFCLLGVVIILFEK
jgi:hypothetical protein